MKASSVKRVAEFVEHHPDEIGLHPPKLAARTHELFARATRRPLRTSAKLSGAEKAAVVLLSLGEEHKALWESLDDEEIKEISQAMSGLGTSAPTWSRTCWSSSSRACPPPARSWAPSSRPSACSTAFLPGEKVDSLMEEIRGPAGRTMWDKLGNVNEAVLANYLKNEYPQTVAVVLSKIKSEHAARVLAALPEDFALECVQRMLRMEPVQRDILDKIEQTLRTEFMSNLARTSKRDSHEMMADIFNNFDRQTECRFIAALEERNRESAERIRALMFVFEDLGKLDPGGVQTLLRAVEKDKLGPGAQGLVGHPARDVLLQHVRARRQDHARGHGIAWARCV